MQPIIFVINPNSTQAVTDAFDRALNALRLSNGPEIRSLTLKEGPPGIESQINADSVTLPLVALVKELDATHGDRVGAFVVACFSDPGIHAVREATQRPVLGISECGVMTAMSLGQNLGVIAILKKSIARHTRYFNALGVANRIVAELPLGMGVLELSDGAKTRAGLLRVGEKLRDEHLADVIVLGCAGMAEHRQWLEQALGIPVVEPTQAATAMALGRALLKW
jgi:Asp/Glu/hydantoin racemase